MQQCPWSCTLAQMRGEAGDPPTRLCGQRKGTVPSSVGPGYGDQSQGLGRTGQ